MSIFNSDLPLVALGVLEGWDHHRPHEIQMDANRRISMRYYVIWRSIIHCDVCFMRTYRVSISEG